MPDPSVAISLAVTQINAGKLDEADKLLSGIISQTDKRTPNLGAHVARGTARALRRELQGGCQTMHCLPVFMPTVFFNAAAEPLEIARQTYQPYLTCLFLHTHLLVAA